MKKFVELDTKEIGDRIVLLDVDGTIVPDQSRQIQPKTKQVIEDLAKQTEVILCSNGKNAGFFAELLNLKTLVCRKPFTREVKNVLPKDKRLVVVGDKYITDGLFAKGLGADFVRVDHERSVKDSLFIKFSYFLDDLIWFILPFFALARPHQWLKNLLVFAPIFFAGSALDWWSFGQTVLAFFAFCFVSSGVYVWNDICDKNSDLLHPRKKERPIASGAVSIYQGYLFLLGLFLVASVFIYFVPQISYPLVAYVVLNIAYSKKLKHVAVIDVASVAIFYLLRVYTGGLATQTYISPWIILCTLFGSLFVIIGKRKAEYAHEQRRRVLEEYSEKALDFMLVVSASLALISYGIYSVIGHELPHLVYSTIFVLLAVYRILNRIYTHPQEAEAPETMVLKDKWVLGSFLGWVIFIFLIFYN